MRKRPPTGAKIRIIEKGDHNYNDCPLQGEFIVKRNLPFSVIVEGGGQYETAIYRFIFSDSHRDK